MSVRPYVRYSYLAYNLSEHLFYGAFSPPFRISTAIEVVSPSITSCIPDFHIFYCFIGRESKNWSIWESDQKLSRKHLEMIKANKTSTLFPIFFLHFPTSQFRLEFPAQTASIMFSSRGATESGKLPSSRSSRCCSCMCRHSRLAINYSLGLLYPCLLSMSKGTFLLEGTA